MAAAIRAALLVAIVAGIAAFGLVLRLPLASASFGSTELAAASGSPDSVAAVPRDDVVRRALARPVFRADRRQASVAFDPDRSREPAPAAAPAEPRPALTVAGIVIGRDSAVLLDGAPGVEGSLVLRRGDTAAGLRVVEITEDRVVIRERDTTWRLRVREPWR